LKRHEGKTKGKKNISLEEKFNILQDVEKHEGTHIFLAK
jgi:hypothetical protein